MDELQLQSHLVDAVRDANGFAFKASHKFLVGVLDLYIKLPDRLGAWVEVKLLRQHPVRGIARLALTPLQRKFILDLRHADGVVGWILAVQQSGVQGKFLMVAGTDPVDTINLSEWPTVVRQRGASWPICELMERIAPRSAR